MTRPRFQPQVLKPSVEATRWSCEGNILGCEQVRGRSLGRAPTRGREVVPRLLELRSRTEASKLARVRCGNMDGVLQERGSVGSLGVGGHGVEHRRRSRSRGFFAGVGHASEIPPHSHECRKANGCSARNRACRVGPSHPQRSRGRTSAGAHGATCCNVSKLK